MATIRKRGNSYQIRVSCGYDIKGNQVEQSMTWKPEPGMTEKQIEKELNRQAVLFEEACLNGHITAAIKFQDFSEQWFREYAEIKLKPQTIRSYHFLEKRVYTAIGYMRMDKITTRTIQKFISQLADEKKYNSKSKVIGKLSPKTIKNYIAFISAVFNYAVKMQMLSINPCKNVTLPPANPKEREVYTIEEVQHMLELFKNESDAKIK